MALEDPLQVGLVVFVGEDGQSPADVGHRAQLGKAVLAAKVAGRVSTDFPQQRPVLELPRPPRIGQEPAQTLPQPE
jgi:hypothetical protein